MNRVVPLLLLVLLAVTATAADRTQPRPSLERVPVDPARVLVGDGDTVTIAWSDDDHERIRILGIDTPETQNPSYNLPYDQPFGQKATGFGLGAFATATKVELLRAAETDPYGRTLGYLFVDGKNYSVLIVRSGLATETVSHYGDNGFPDEAQAVLEASRTVGPVPFEPPFQFRKRMREVSEWRRDHPDGD
jgi:micrococcal nuclease